MGNDDELDGSNRGIFNIKFKEIIPTLLIVLKKSAVLVDLTMLYMLFLMDIPSLKQHREFRLVLFMVTKRQGSSKTLSRSIIPHI